MLCCGAGGAAARVARQRADSSSLSGEQPWWACWARWRRAACHPSARQLCRSSLCGPLASRCRRGLGRVLHGGTQSVGGPSGLVLRGSPSAARATPVDGRCPRHSCSFVRNLAAARRACDPPALGGRDEARSTRLARAACRAAARPSPRCAARAALRAWHTPGTRGLSAALGALG